MSGMGIREQFLAARQLRGTKLWREESFLQQLSLNGSLLLMANHDQAYLRILADQMRLDPGVNWDLCRGILRIMDAGKVRQLLWHTSLRWWLVQRRLEIHALRHSASIGRLEELRGYAELRALRTGLDLREAQLADLEWCSKDRSTGEIEVIENPGQLRELRRAGPRLALPAASDS